MADRSKTIVQLDPVTTVVANDIFIVESNTSGNSVTTKVTANTLLNNSQCNFTVGNSYVLSVNTIIIRNRATPANSTVTVASGTMYYDNNYIYVAIANNTLKRVALESF